jgi:hypothetical protein
LRTGADGGPTGETGAGIGERGGDVEGVDRAASPEVPPRVRPGQEMALRFPAVLPSILTISV